jgi:hypothetical protein
MTKPPKMTLAELDQASRDAWRKATTPDKRPPAWLWWLPVLVCGFWACVIAAWVW